MTFHRLLSLLLQLPAKAAMIIVLFVLFLQAFAVATNVRGGIAVKSFI